MKTLPTILIALLLCGLLTACPTGENQNADSQTPANSAATNANQNANQAKDDVEEFETIVKLPFHPQQAVWREEPLGKTGGDARVPGPTDRKLTAVLLFTGEESEKIVQQAATHKPGAPATLSAESWYPDELVAATQTSGDETMKGTAYPANDFFQTPYLEGRITRVENSNFFVLELFTK